MFVLRSCCLCQVAHHKLSLFHAGWILIRLTIKVYGKSSSLDWLIHLLDDWVSDRLINWFVDWMIDQIDWLIDWLFPLIFSPYTGRFCTSVIITSEFRAVKEYFFSSKAEFVTSQSKIQVVKFRNFHRKWRLKKRRYRIVSHYKNTKILLRKYATSHAY